MYNFPEGEKKMRVLPLIFLIFLVGCATLPEQVQKNLHKNDFATALQLLEEKGVGEVISPDADENDLKARKIYSDAVEIHYNTKIKNDLSLGNLRAAYDYAIQAQSICSWSNNINSTLEDLNKKIKNLNNLQNKWREFKHIKNITLNDANEISKDLIPVYNYINDSPFLVQLLTKSALKTAEYWAINTEKSQFKSSEALIRNFYTSLAKYPNVKENIKEIASAYQNTFLLYNSNFTSQNTTNINEPQDTLINLVLFLKRTTNFIF